MSVATQHLRRLVGSVFDALLPHSCWMCGEWCEGGDAVCACGEDLHAMTQQPHCRRCGRTVPVAAIHPEGCAACLREQAWNLRRVTRVGEYKEPLRGAVLAAKFQRSTRARQHLGEILADRIRGEAWCDEIDVLVPVPMHLLRRVQRPCNHARELAEFVAAGLNRSRPRGRRVRVNRWDIARRRYAPSQMSCLSKAQRYENVAGCFFARRSWRLRGKTVCIIDNLMLSGATLVEMSKVLRRAGAKAIYAAVVARA
jgi:ComF family protein